MKIVDVKVLKFHTISHVVRDSEFHSHPGPAHDSTENLLVITCDDGTEGLAFGPMDERVILSTVKEILIGEDPFFRERIWRRLVQLQRLRRNLTESTLCAVDVAIWDLCGKKLNLPVSKILGQYREYIPAYASIMVGDDIPGGLDTPSAYAKFAASLVKQGYKAIKLHTWMPPIVPEPSVKMDLEAARKVREEVGDDIVLLMDPYHFYSREEALELADGLHSLGFLWMEEPLDEHSMENFIWLQKKTKLHICGPETVEGKMYSRADWIRRNAADIGRAGLIYSGGITSVMKTVHLYEANGMSLELHGNHIGSLHVLGAMGIDGKYYERGMLHPLLDYETPKPWFTKIHDPLMPDGTVPVPKDSGIGYSPNWDYINANLIK